MIMVEPTYSGIGWVVQLFVPPATPESPLDVDQVTCVTPAISDAVPLTTIEASDVATLVLAGDRIVIDGGVVLGPGAGFEGVGLGGFVPDGLTATRVTKKL